MKDINTNIEKGNKRNRHHKDQRMTNGEGVRFIVFQVWRAPPFVYQTKRSVGTLSYCGGIFYRHN